VERDPVKVVRLAGGQARTREVIAFAGRQRLEQAIRDGRLVRVRRGVLALPELPDPVAVAASVGGVVSHASAAALIGLDQVTRPALVDVTVPRGRKPPADPRVRLHWTRYPDDDGGVTSPVRTVLDCASALPFAEALAIADSALREHFVEDLIGPALASRGPGRSRRLRVARAADGRADNPMESVLRAVVLDAGLTGFVPQVQNQLPRRRHHADLADVRRRLVLEADGFGVHGERSAFVRDCERDHELVAADWTVLRFAWEHVMLRQPHVARVVVTTCARLDARGGRR